MLQMCKYMNQYKAIACNISIIKKSQQCSLRENWLNELWHSRIIYSHMKRRNHSPVKISVLKRLRQIIVTWGFPRLQQVLCKLMIDSKTLPQNNTRRKKQKRRREKRIKLLIYWWINSYTFCNKNKLSAEICLFGKRKQICTNFYTHLKKSFMEQKVKEN